jgi:glyoxylase-like metal-dependent hydrolase (beta-lactamase superfamily II)
MVVADNSSTANNLPSLLRPRDGEKIISHDNCLIYKLPAQRRRVNDAQVRTMTRPEIDAFFDPATSSVAYLVHDPAAKRAAVVDPILDYEPKRARTSTVLADRILARARELGLTVEWILETHIHADHFSAAGYLRRALGAKTAIGQHVAAVQRHFAGFYNLGPEFRTDGSQFDRLLGEGETLALGNLAIEVWHTPGHTPACASYGIGDAVFCGDTIFMPDYGTARCDFPGGDAVAMYRSIRRLFTLPPATRIFVGHDYAPGGRAVAWETTVAAQRAGNIFCNEKVEEADFVRRRRERDAKLEPPDLMLLAVQFNLRGGAAAPAEGNGVSYLKLPLNAF